MTTKQCGLTRKFELAPSTEIAPTGYAIESSANTSVTGGHAESLDVINLVDLAPTKTNDNLSIQSYSSPGCHHPDSLFGADTDSFEAITHHIKRIDRCVTTESCFLVQPFGGQAKHYHLDVTTASLENK